MGLFLAIMVFIACCVGSVVVLFAEAAMDETGLRRPVLAPLIFVAGTLIAAFLAYTHFHPLPW